MKTVDSRHEKQLFEQRFFKWSVLTAPVFIIVAGAFLQKFVLLAGVRKGYIGLAVGLMSFIPALAAFFFTGLIEQKRLRARIFTYAYIFRFAIVAVLALVPSLIGPGNVHLLSILYVFVMVMIALCYTFGNICMESLVKQAVPRYRYGQYAARIAAWSSVISIVPGLACAYFADRIAGLLPLQVLLVAAALIGSAITIPFLKAADFSADEARRRPAPLAPLRDRAYMKFILFYGLQFFFVSGCSAFWSFFFLEELGISLFAMILIVSCCSLFAPVFTWIWGMVNDHFGPRATFIYTSLFTWVSCLLLILPIPALPCAALFCLLVGFYGSTGVFSRGRMLAVVALRNAMMPAEQSTTYIGLFQLVSGFLGFLSGAAAGAALESMGQITVWNLSPYRLLFLICNVVFGCLTVLPFFFLKERYATSIDLKKLGLALINPAVFRDFYSIAMINNSNTPHALEKTVKKLAARSTYVGRTELLRNFHSPSIRIRRQAARGLAYVRDPEALQALKAEATTPHSPLAIECIEALETLKAGEIIQELLTHYHGMPKEVRMRLAIAALNIDSEPLNRALEKVLVNENEPEAASEIILGLAGVGKWRIAVSALDRLQNAGLSREDVSKLWMALGTVFTRRLKPLSFVTSELREPGSAITRGGMAMDEKLLASYFREERESFHERARILLEKNRQLVLDCYCLSDENVETALFIIDAILEHVRIDKDRLAMMVVIMIFHELTGFATDQRVALVRP